MRSLVNTKNITILEQPPKTYNKLKYFEVVHIIGKKDQKDAKRMEKQSNFAERLRLALDEKGLSQADLCRLTALDRSTVSKYLRGLKHPKIDVIRRCAAILFVSPEWLEGYDVDKIPRPVQLSPLENDLIMTFRSCDAAEKYAIIEYIKTKGG